MVREGATDVGIAVVDTGIDLSHSDLNVHAGINCIDEGADPEDGHGHGTHCAGSVAAKNNGAGKTGVAAGAAVWAVKVLGDDGSGSMESVICGLEWVLDNAEANNIKVVSMSLGGEGTSDRNCGADNDDPEHAAICALVDAGITVVVAAGASAAAAGGRRRS